MDPYTTLGVSREASAEEVTRAFRKKAKRAHPDGGGSSEAFHALQFARDVLTDPERRREYDEHGTSERTKDRRAMVLEAIATMVMGAVDQAPDIDHVDILANIVQAVRTTQRHLDDVRRELEAKIAKRERAMARFKRRGGGDNVVAGFLEVGNRQLRAQVANNAQQRELGAEMIAVLEEYRYEVATHPMAATQQGSLGGIGSIFQNMMGGATR